MHNDNSKKIQTPTLIIKDNVIKYKDSIIQISNISKCEIAPQPHKPYPVWLFVGLILGISLMFNKDYFSIGLFAVFLFGIIIFAIFCFNTDPTMFFILELNSGSIILFSSRNKDFLWEAENEVIKCFNNKGKGCIINFSECTITHSQIGEENFMNNSEEQNGI